ncbi:SREBP regulating gene protein-like [Pollicipes pollicipes]|uniref:SREBP regulating gene protein-like n=1 Tax=Pollicipes pollicipes TaxID=41117 RepID=UPI00188526F4|nr:SREBP regulating gene protein-like [Pollicipes pollicipes]XP_037093330.1 SREBP regulating gene protein-like [Pollicipes pollicipes]
MIAWLGQKFCRLLRKPPVLAVILLLSLVYCLVNLFDQKMLGLVSDPDDAVPVPIDPALILQPEDGANSSDTDPHGLSCRNSVQGVALIADDRGHVCERQHLETTGCCDQEAASTRRFLCESCSQEGCCSVYEHCISCCLHPDKKPLLHSVLGKASHRFNLLFSSVTDHFELCLTKCRTSSQSVRHQNVYRNTKVKFCYGESAPPLDGSD